MRPNLAFYKRSGLPWTMEDATKIYAYTGDTGDTHTPPSDFGSGKYYYDNGTSTTPEMYNWSSQQIYGLIVVAFEDIFPTKLHNRRRK